MTLLWEAKQGEWGCIPPTCLRWRVRCGSLLHTQSVTRLPVGTWIEHKKHEEDEEETQEMIIWNLSSLAVVEYEDVQAWPSPSNGMWLLQALHTLHVESFAIQSSTHPVILASYVPSFAVASLLAALLCTLHADTMVVTCHLDTQENALAWNLPFVTAAKRWTSETLSTDARSTSSSSSPDALWVWGFPDLPTPRHQATFRTQILSPMQQQCRQWASSSSSSRTIVLWSGTSHQYDIQWTNNQQNHQDLWEQLHFVEPDERHQLFVSHLQQMCGEDWNWCSVAVSPLLPKSWNPTLPSVAKFRKRCVEQWNAIFPRPEPYTIRLSFLTKTTIWEVSNWGPSSSSSSSSQMPLIEWPGPPPRLQSSMNPLMPVYKDTEEGKRKEQEESLDWLHPVVASGTWSKSSVYAQRLLPGTLVVCLDAQTRVCAGWLRVHSIDWKEQCVVFGSRVPGPLPPHLRLSVLPYTFL